MIPFEPGDVDGGVGPHGAGDGAEDGTGPGRPPTVTIRIPADPEYLALLRSACGQLAPRLGCTLSEVADLRLAVDEACGLLLRNGIRLHRGAEDDGLMATFVVDGPGLRVTVAMAADAFAMPEDGEFGWTVLTALVDGFTWHVEGSTVTVEIVKKHAAGRQRWTRPPRRTGHTR